MNKILYMVLVGASMACASVKAPVVVTTVERITIVELSKRCLSEQITDAEYDALVVPFEQCAVFKQGFLLGVYAAEKNHAKESFDNHSF